MIIDCQGVHCGEFNNIQCTCNNLELQAFAIRPFKTKPRELQWCVLMLGNNFNNKIPNNVCKLLPANCVISLIKNMKIKNIQMCLWWFGVI